MESYSQNKEDLKVLRYFKGRKGTLLEVGANDGTTLSNSKLMIESGWLAYLVEPSSVFKSLESLHKSNNKVVCLNYGVGEKEETVKFYESKNHVKNGTDLALVSSVNFKETKRWRDNGVEFTETEVKLLPFKKLWDNEGQPTLNFISIDCEGLDWQILKQIDLKEVGCEVLCIEWNGNKTLEQKFADYCANFGLKEIHRNAENLIFALPV